MSPYGILRWLELIVGVIVCGLVATTCNWYACTNFTNQFGEVAWGQGYVLLAGGGAIIITGIIIILYSMNIHRVNPGCVTGLEKGLTIIIILCYIALAAVECYYAAIAGNKNTARPWEELNNLARPDNHGIKPQWIAAAVLAWINVILYILDLVGQCSPNYPAQYTLV